MLGAFLLPLGHLLLDDAWIDSIASGFGFLLLHLPHQSVVPCLKRLRRPSVAFRQSALEDLETARKRKPIRIQANRFGGFEHQGANHKMRER